MGTGLRQCVSVVHALGRYGLPAYTVRRRVVIGRVTARPGPGHAVSAGAWTAPPLPVVIELEQAVGRLRICDEINAHLSAVKHSRAIVGTM